MVPRAGIRIKPWRGERERERVRERELVPNTCYCFYPSQVHNHNKIIIKQQQEQEQEKERREREGKDTYLGHEAGEPGLTFPGFNALFYRPCPRGHQRSQLSPIRSIMIQKRSIFNIGLFHDG